MADLRKKHIKDTIEREFLLFAKEADFAVRALFSSTLEGMVEIAFMADAISTEEFHWLCEAIRELHTF